MLSQIHYLIRSKIDGRYLTARLHDSEKDRTIHYLLIFSENYEALTYLNAHAAAQANQFSVESLTANQLKSLLQRLEYNGIGLVEDPLEPRINFLSRE